MGLDTTHGCWRGAYSAFMRWREKIAECAGLPPLMLMEGFFEKGNYTDPFERDIMDKTKRRYPYGNLPIRWDCLKPSALHQLLYHSDCDGEIEAENCGPIADALEELMPELEKAGDGGGHIGLYADKTQKFINGLREAASKGENVNFH